MTSELDAAIAQLETDLDHATEWDDAHVQTTAAGLRLALDALKRRPGRARVDVAAAWQAGFYKAVGRAEWDDMYDYAALCAKEYADALFSPAAGGE